MIMIGEANLCSATRGPNLNEELCIDLRKFFPLTWNIIFVIDCLNWADRLAGSTIDALIGLDIEHAVAFVDAIDWALFNAGFILHIDTWLGNYICHEQPPKVQVKAKRVEVTF
jgi:hypothetical protein